MHFNGLTEGEAERLAILIEECGEVVQVIGKILRHGLRSRHPKTDAANRDLLVMELGHVKAAISMLIEAGDMTAAELRQARNTKLGSVSIYLHHAENVKASRNVFTPKDAKEAARE